MRAFVMLCFISQPILWLGCCWNEPTAPSEPGPAVAPAASRDPAATSSAAGAIAPSTEFRSVGPGIQRRPLDRAGPAGKTLFAEVSAESSGVTMLNALDLQEPRKYLYNSPFVAGAVAIGDVDGNGWPDLFLTNGPRGNRLYLQETPWKFRDATQSAKLDAENLWSAGAALVDIDNDGDLDIYVANYDAPNQLFLNNGAGEFEERAEAWGLAVVDASLMPTFADVDRDGDLDLYLVTNQYTHPGGRPKQPPYEVANGTAVILPAFEKYYAIEQLDPGKFTVDEAGRPDRLLLNDGMGHFEDVTDAAGIIGRGFGLSAVWWDYDQDGWPDLYVANDYLSPDRFYRNNRDGTFTDILVDALPYTAWFSMGADAADVNNDGMLDLMTTDMAATTHYKAKIGMGDMDVRLKQMAKQWPPQAMRNALFMNTGTGRFLEAAYLAGVAKTDWTWGNRLADFDNDGRVDLFVSNGAARHFNHSDRPIDPSMRIGHNVWDLFEDAPPLKEQNLAYRNLGDLAFQEVSRDWGLAHIGVSSAAALGDLDADGDLDLVVVHLDEPVSLYRNDSNQGHAVTFELTGRRSNRFGVGAELRIRTAGGQQVRPLSPYTGYLASNQPLVHFGIGDETEIQELEVRWPSGYVQTFQQLEADFAYRITEPADFESPVAKQAPAFAATWFEPAEESFGLVHQHQETPFDDYGRQPLLPGKHSQLGPGLAWGDADGDGHDDLFIAGPAGQAGTLWRRMDDGHFKQQPGPWQQEAAAEDMQPLWIDVDSDGALDLLVTRGGSEFETGDPRLLDRIYRNEGEGRFALDEAAMPPLAASSSCAVAADFDADGDLDVFIGGRLIPGSYPSAPPSRLLRNDEGTLVDATDELAPGLRRVGLVTAALWSDANADGKVDLLVALEWGPIRLFQQFDGRFTDKTKRAGMEEQTGWWNSLLGCDVDRDGDLDYVAMNVGWNTKYGVAAANKPAVLFHGDMEGNGRKRLVEAKPIHDDWFPVRGRSCSSKAMPFLATKFESYHAFAVSDLLDIYGGECLEKADRYEAVQFASGVYVNSGDGQFHFQPWPRIVQISPGFGIVAAEFNGDDRTDLFVAQNLFSREPETGLWRGGLGQLLAGNAAGLPAPVAAGASGLVIDGDAKAATMVDLDRDGWPDLVVAQNNGPLRVYRNQGRTSKDREILVMHLQGVGGNPQAIGARMDIIRADGSREACEVYGGSGYLSQSASEIFFGSPPSNPVVRVEIQWPDGARSTHDVTLGNARLSIRHPQLD